MNNCQWEAFCAEAIPLSHRKLRDCFTPFPMTPWSK